MTWSNPILLWSLLGLSVPIAIHLLSRKEGQVIRLGSIRHVQETSTQQFKGIKLNELLLLAVRCTLIFVFCLLLSGLRCTGISNQKWVVVETGFKNDPVVTSAIDSLEKDGYQQHQLCEGFPAIGSDCVSHLNYWELVEQLKEKNLADVVVLSSNRLENFRGKRVSLPSNIKWIAFPSDKIDFPVETVKINNDSLYLRQGHSSTDQTFFTTEKMKTFPAPISASSPDSVHIAIVADDQHNYDRRILMASLSAIQKTFPIRMVVDESKSPVSENCDWIFWLPESRTQRKTFASTVSMLPKSSDNLIERTGPKEWIFTERLNEEVALDQGLTVQLAHLIVPSIRQQEIARSNDRRTIPDSLAWSSQYQLPSASVITSEVDRFLIICLLVLLLFERIIAYRRNQ